MAVVEEQSGRVMPTLLVVVEEAFAAGPHDLVLHPRIVVQAASSQPFAVELRTPEGTRLSATARLDLAHLRNAQGTFALVRLLNRDVHAAPPGTEVWRIE